MSNPVANEAHRPNCQSTSCPYRPRGLVGVNGPCRCDQCPDCGGSVRPGCPPRHRSGCIVPDWRGPWHIADNTAAALMVVRTAIALRNRAVAALRASGQHDWADELAEDVRVFEHCRDAMAP